MLKREYPFSIRYRPEPWHHSEYELGQADDHATALETAAGYSRQYYGEISPIIIRLGKKKIHEIPARGRAAP